MEKIKKLKKFFNLYKLDGYLVPKNDEFFGEYISKSKDKLNFISNFSGSYGFAIILKKKNYLFVDGRYTLQAKLESSRKFDIVTIPNKSPSEVLGKKKFKIGFDPTLHTLKSLKMIFNKTNCKLIPIQKNLIDEIWKRKKKKNKQEFFVLPKKAKNFSYHSKLSRLMQNLKKKKIDFQLITASENIAWLLNIRGNDYEFSPIPLAFMSIDINKNINVFCNLKRINNQLRRKLKIVKFIDIKNIEQILSKVNNKKVLIDASTCSVYFENILKKRNKIIKLLDPIYFMKSIKSKAEIRNTFQSHIYDGAALTKFLFWVKRNYKKKKIDEINAQEKLLKFRRKNKNFKYLSFPTISGSGPNGAIIHYRATKKSNRKLKKGDVYLVDSGGQYNFGTTDVTRTISLDNNNQKIKEIFTRVLKGHIAVSTFKIKKGTNGSQIDKVARKPLKEIGLDYPHGTGHGVGYFLNVHEGPLAISKNNKVKLQEGMIVSNEPGYYKKGKFGIRIENLITIKKKRKNYFFENLTMAPIEKSLIEKRILKINEINWLNEYHNSVYKNLRKYMTSYELNELKAACSKI